MIGVILAAGEGSRLSRCVAERYMKPLAIINGVPLITYPVRSMLAAGVEELLVVGNIYNHSPLGLAVRSAGARRYSVVVNPDFGEACLSLRQALVRLAGRGFILSMSDHIYPPVLVEKLTRECSGDICVAGDRRPRYVDVEEATKIEAEEGRALRFSKLLTSYSFIDMGVFYISPKASKTLLDYMDYPHAMSLSDLWNRVIVEGVLEVSVVDATDTPWMEVDDEEDYFQAVSGPGRELAWRVLYGSLEALSLDKSR
ncbi:MAG: NTP transferase domain-containing protein [Crenarchaeota archaeon]|nr:NTP transferase domain-containing protein [Thermoproteota archaeon]